MRNNVTVVGVSHRLCGRGNSTVLSVNDSIPVYVVSIDRSFSLPQDQVSRTVAIICLSISQLAISPLAKAWPRLELAQFHFVHEYLHAVGGSKSPVIIMRGCAQSIKLLQRDFNLFISVFIGLSLSVTTV